MKQHDNMLHIFRCALQELKTSDIFRQFIRYICAGGIAFIADAGILFILTSEIGINYLISAPLSFIL